MRRVAIMQPYFVPYAGYFRLAAEADLFVVYDCVQFPRRGYVHRNKLPDARGRPQWLTLPLAHAPQSAKIGEMTFAEEAPARLATARRRFPALEALPDAWEALFSRARGALLPWLEQSLALCWRHLGIDCPTLRSSTLGIEPEIAGQDRILEICRRLGADTYINAPGGRGLYREEAFARHGIRLEFLPPYEGSSLSILYEIAGGASVLPLAGGPDTAAARRAVSNRGLA